MNRKIIKTALFAIFLVSSSLARAGFAIGAAPDEGGPQPSLFIESAVFDLGDITPGAIVQHEFVLKNQGASDLELLDVRPGCGCTVASFDKTIAPGATGKLLMKVRIYREWAGQDVSKSVWLISNDPKNPQSILTMRGKVLPHGTDGDKPRLTGKQ